jgi:hypothetical protein
MAFLRSTAGAWRWASVVTTICGLDAAVACGFPDVIFDNSSGGGDGRAGAAPVDAGGPPQGGNRSSGAEPSGSGGAVGGSSGTKSSGNDGSLSNGHTGEDGGGQDAANVDASGGSGGGSPVGSSSGTIGVGNGSGSSSGGTGSGAGVSSSGGTSGSGSGNSSGSGHSGSSSGGSSGGGTGSSSGNTGPCTCGAGQMLAYPANISCGSIINLLPPLVGVGCSGPAQGFLDAPACGASDALYACQALLAVGQPCSPHPISTNATQACQ